MPKLAQHPEIIVQARRGGTVESVHRACAALAAPDGEIVERWGDPGMVTFWRSSAKPLQAQAWLADGTVDHYGWGAEELAIMSASHEGLDFQADLVRRMLADIGLSEDDLRCDARLKARHNCSGNHTGFLAACARHGWDVASYQQPGHPAQQAAFAAFAAIKGPEQTTIPTGVDGCGIVCYAATGHRRRLHLRAAARVAARDRRRHARASPAGRGAGVAGHDTDGARSPAPPASAARRACAASRSRTGAAWPPRSSTAPTARASSRWPWPSSKRCSAPV